MRSRRRGAAASMRRAPWRAWRARRADACRSRRRLPHRSPHPLVERSLRTAGARPLGACGRQARAAHGRGGRSGLSRGHRDLPAIAGMGVAADSGAGRGAGEVARLPSCATDSCRDCSRGFQRRVRPALADRTGFRITCRSSYPGGGESVLTDPRPARHRRLVGAACTAMTGEPSHVLRAIGVTRHRRGLALLHARPLAPGAR